MGRDNRFQSFRRILRNIFGNHTIGWRRTAWYLLSTPLQFGQSPVGWVPFPRFEKRGQNYRLLMVWALILAGTHLKYSTVRPILVLVNGQRYSQRPHQHLPAHCSLLECFDQGYHFETIALLRHPDRGNPPVVRS